MGTANCCSCSMKIIFLLAIVMQKSFASSRNSDWRNSRKQVRLQSFFETPTKNYKAKPKNAFTEFNEQADSNRFGIFNTQEKQINTLNKSLSEKTKEKRNIDKTWAKLLRLVEEEKRKNKASRGREK